MDFNAVKSHVQGVFHAIDKHTKHIKVLDQFEHRTGLPRSYAVLAFGVVYLIAVFANVGGIGQLLSNLAGFAYPCYRSLQALKTFSGKDDTELLTYWVVFAFLNVLEFWTSALLYWVPSYFLIKTLFLFYLSSPYTNGATHVYNRVIKPLSDKFVATPAGAGPADDLLNKVQSKLE